MPLMRGSTVTMREPHQWAIARSSRLTRTADFRRVIQSGERASGRRLSVYVLAPDRVASQESVRAGFVARREVGGAVARNRARRLLREAWRRVAAEVRGPLDAVFLARPAIVDAGMEDVEAELRALLTQRGVIRS